MASLSQQYAQKLYQLIISTEKDRLSSGIQGFLKILADNGDRQIVDKIFSDFLKIWEKEKRELTVSVLTATSLSDESREIIIQYLKKKTNYQEISLNEKIDRDILGGVVLRYDDQVIDGSLKNALNNLKNNLNK